MVRWIDVARHTDRVSLNEMKGPPPILSYPILALSLSTLLLLYSAALLACMHACVQVWADRAERIHDDMLVLVRVKISIHYSKRRKGSPE